MGRCYAGTMDHSRVSWALCLMVGAGACNTPLTFAVDVGPCALEGLHATYLPGQVIHVAVHSSSYDLVQPSITTDNADVAVVSETETRDPADVWFVLTTGVEGTTQLAVKSGPVVLETHTIRVANPNRVELYPQSHNMVNPNASDRWGPELRVVPGVESQWVARYFNDDQEVNGKGLLRPSAGTRPETGDCRDVLVLEALEQPASIAVVAGTITRRLTVVPTAVGEVQTLRIELNEVAGRNPYVFAAVTGLTALQQRVVLPGPRWQMDGDAPLGGGPPGSFRYVLDPAQTHRLAALWEQLSSEADIHANLAQLD